MTPDQASEGATALALVTQWTTMVQNLQNDISAGAQMSGIVLTNGRSYSSLETLLTSGDSSQLLAASLTLFEAKLVLAQATLSAI